MPLTVRSAILGLALALPLAGASGEARVDVDIQLLLAIDSSASVNFQEFRLQVMGTAGALRDPEIIEAIELWAPNGIAVSVVQWSGRRQQLVAVNWTRVGDAASIGALADRIENMGRTWVGETAIGDMLTFALDHLERGPYEGARKIIDVSGDGKSNAGAQPAALRTAAASADISINGLAILNEDLTLDLYYEDEVIGGPGAFVITAQDYEAFATAMRKKLLKEIRGAPLG
ncbi:MAG: DUF1194 domain-containing protein [Pseudomonadota bacterium]